MDDCSGFLINRTLNRKSDLAKVGNALIKRLKAENKITMGSIRCDNTGENKKINEMCIDQDLVVKFECNAVGTPQQNGRVERKFATLQLYNAI